MIGPLKIRYHGERSYLSGYCHFVENDSACSWEWGFTNDEQKLKAAILKHLKDAHLEPKDPWWNPTKEQMPGR